MISIDFAGESIKHGSLACHSLFDTPIKLDLVFIVPSIVESK